MLYKNHYKNDGLEKHQNIKSKQKMVNLTTGYNLQKIY